MKSGQTLVVKYPAFAGRIGVARRDITPPLGIYARMWGSAEHDVAEGVHRPLLATVLSVSSASDRGDPVILASLDLAWWRQADDAAFVRDAVREALGLPASRLLLHLSHSHASLALSLADRDKPGGDKIEPYMVSLRQGVIDAAREAIANAADATLSWATGRCNLACHRNQREPDARDVVVGYDPDTPADDTVLVGRVTDGSGRVRATIVNYACHPTTLGGQNRLISPDYVGAMRETVESATNGAPCVFLLGAAAELAPRRQYVKDPAVADENGRQLGHAVVSALAGMFGHQTCLRYQGVEESGTRLGRWGEVAQVPDRALAAAQIDVDLPLKKDLLPVDLDEQLRACEDRVLAERLERMGHLRRRFVNKRWSSIPIWLWRLGDAIVVATPMEAHSRVQTSLRERFQEQAVVVVNIVNGSDGYLVADAEYDLGTYQSTVTPFDRGGLEKVIESVSHAIEHLIRSPEDTAGLGTADKRVP